MVFCQLGIGNRVQRPTRNGISISENGSEKKAFLLFRYFNRYSQFIHSFVSFASFWQGYRNIVSQLLRSRSGQTTITGRIPYCFRTVIWVLYKAAMSRYISKPSLNQRKVKPNHREGWNTATESNKIEIEHEWKSVSTIDADC